MKHKDITTIINDMDKSVAVMHEVGSWMKESGKEYSLYWDPENMNRGFMSKHAEDEDFFVALANNVPVASVILQDNERNQSWNYIDKGSPQKALYIHWLCVSRQYAGRGLPRIMVDFAREQALERGLFLLRLDTQANETKLCRLYERLGFELMGVEPDDTHPTAYYQMELV